MIVRPLTSADKPALAAALAASGIKARIKVLRIGLRVCFEGERAPVAAVLNAMGFLHASGGAFTESSFNGLGEVFVRYAPKA